MYSFVRHNSTELYLWSW